MTQVDIMSCNNVPIFKGRVGSERNCVEIRRLLLAEMTARAAKGMLRQFLRTSATQNRVTTHQTQVSIFPHSFIPTSAEPISTEYSLLDALKTRNTHQHRHQHMPSQYDFVPGVSNC